MNEAKNTLEPEQLGLLQAEGAQRDKATTKKMRPRTKKELGIVASFVERFIAGKEIDSFPVSETDIAEESIEPAPEPTIWMALTKQIESAFSKSVTPPSQTASFFASMLLKSRDQKYERDVLVLPQEAIRPERILAHVQAIPIKLEPRVAISIARRTCLVLWNKDRWVVDPGLAKPPAPASLSGLVDALAAPGVSDAAEPGDEEMCMDCGDVYTGEHKCAEPEPRAKPLPKSDPTPEPKPDNSKALAELAARKCTGHARSKTDQLFFVSGGIGNPGDHITMPAGEILEVLEPNVIEEADQQRAMKVHQHQLVVVRWRGKARLLINKTIERVTQAEFVDQERKRRA
jgi:hypothetical protein